MNDEVGRIWKEAVLHPVFVWAERIPGLRADASPHDHQNMKQVSQPIESDVPYVISSLVSLFLLRYLILRKYKAV